MIDRWSFSYLLLKWSWMIEFVIKANSVVRVTLDGRHSLENRLARNMKVRRRTRPRRRVLWIIFTAEMKRRREKKGTLVVIKGTSCRRRKCQSEYMYECVCVFIYMSQWYTLLDEEREWGRERGQTDGQTDRRTDRPASSATLLRGSFALCSFVPTESFSLSLLILLRLFLSFFLSSFFPSFFLSSLAFFLSFFRSVYVVVLRSFSFARSPTLRLSDSLLTVGPFCLSSQPCFRRDKRTSHSHHSAENRRNRASSSSSSSCSRCNLRWRRFECR